MDRHSSGADAHKFLHETDSLHLRCTVCPEKALRDPGPSGKNDATGRQGPVENASLVWDPITSSPLCS